MLMAAGAQHPAKFASSAHVPRVYLTWISRVPEQVKRPLNSGNELTDMTTGPGGQAAGPASGHEKLPVSGQHHVNTESDRGSGPNPQAP